MVPETVKHFIGGRYTFSTLRKSYGVTDPATGKEYAQVEVGLGADINQAVLAAKTALESGPWPRMAAADRAASLRAIADAIDSRADDIAAAEALGPGLPVTEAREQAARAAEIFRITAPETTGASSNRLTLPAGVAGLITPWRTPFLSQARALAPALAAGCTVVLKADEWAPLPAALLAEIITTVGLPDGVLNIVHGSLHRKAPGPQARDALIAHPAVARLSFAGDAAARQEVTLAAATRGKRLSAEIGGNSPCLIFADADLDQAIDGALSGAFALNGQRRSATSRILVERPVYDGVVSRLAEHANGIPVGNPSDPATGIGSLPHIDHYDALTSFVRLGLREGARLAAGGLRPADLPEGNYLAATVFADVTPEMQIFSERICGPLARVTPFDTDEEAAALAGSVAAETAYVWTGDPQRARRLAPNIESPSIWVNSYDPDDLHTDDIGFYTQTRTMVERTSS